jgi:hypothetical protein
MTNAELIKALRCESVINDEHPRCESCKYGVVVCHGSREDVYGCDSRRIENDAADALEAADKQIEELERNFSDVCNANGSLACERNKLLNDVRELEAQMPMRGEWIDENRRTRSSKFVCSACKRTCYDIQPTRNKAWTKRCRYNYCPNRGARMRYENQTDNV